MSPFPRTLASLPKLISSLIMHSQMTSRSFIGSILQHVAEGLSHYASATLEAKQSSSGDNTYDSLRVMPGAWPEVIANATSISIEAHDSPLIMKDAPPDEEIAAIIRDMPGAWPSEYIRSRSGQSLTSCQYQSSAECDRPVKYRQCGKWQQGTRLERGIPLGSFEFLSSTSRTTLPDITNGTSLLIGSPGSTAYPLHLSPTSSLASTRSTSSEGTTAGRAETSETSMTTSPATTKPDIHSSNVKTSSPTHAQWAGRPKKHQEFTTKSHLLSQTTQVHLIGKYEEFSALPTAPQAYKGKQIQLRFAQAAEHSRETEPAKTGEEDVESSRSCPDVRTARKVEYWVQHTAQDSVASLTETDIFGRHDRIPRHSSSAVSIEDGKQSKPQRCGPDPIETCAERMNCQKAADSVTHMRGVKYEGRVVEEKETYGSSKSLREAWRSQPKRLSW